MMMPRLAANDNRTPWFNAEEGAVNQRVFAYVEAVERQQFALFDRFEKCEALYDPNNSAMGGGSTEQLGLVTENVVASNIDTVAAVIASHDVRARFMTDDGDWSTQRIAKHLEWYADGVAKQMDVALKCQLAFKEAAKKGTGLIKVYANQYDEICVEHVRIDDVVVDEAQCKNGAAPRHLHQRMVNVDREELKARFPEFEVEIDSAQRGPSGWRNWAGYRPVENDELVVIESWKLPVGIQGRDGYLPGRHTICIYGCDLLDEEYHKTHFPFAKLVWSERSNGWYGISLAERIAGIQRALNKRNWQIDRNLDQIAVPTTFVRPADAQLAVKNSNKAGAIAIYKGDLPETRFPQAVSAETYQNRNDMKSAAFEESGVSRMTATAMKPAGLDSGVALREYRDSTTQRFALQEKAYERLYLDTVWLVIGVCKDLGAAAPVIDKRAKFGRRKIKWADVDMGDVKVQIVAASTLSKTPAGRYQTALEWAQAGVISTDEWRTLSEHPDLDRVLSLYTQGIESVECDIEAIEEGVYVVPEPFINLQLAQRHGQMAYLRDRDLGAPEEVLESLRQYVVQAAHWANPPAPANDNVAMGPELIPGEAAPMPGTAAPQSALAPQAMDLMAG